MDVIIRDEVANADIVWGLTWGDEGKGKIVAHLLRNKIYDWVCRWNGGCNAGHTIYIDNKKYHTHLVPSGVLFGVKCFIGPNCYINIQEFRNELEYLEENGFDTSLIFISPQAHIITEPHILEDRNKLTSTNKGIGPCAKDKYDRKGLRVMDFWPEDLQKHLIKEQHYLYGNILCEGAQGYGLDINYGNYPYVTSSETLPYSACSLGFSPKKIRCIYGACKIYDTRVGQDPLFDNKIIESEIETLENVALEGKEYGVTTGRLRKVNWLNYDNLINAINISGTDIVIVSKVDILENMGIFKIIKNNNLITFNTLEDLKCYLSNTLFKESTCLKTVFFSNHPEFVEDLD